MELSPIQLCVVQQHRKVRAHNTHNSKIRSNPLPFPSCSRLHPIRASKSAPFSLHAPSLFQFRRSVSLFVYPFSAQVLTVDRSHHELEHIQCWPWVERLDSRPRQVWSLDSRRKDKECFRSQGAVWSFGFQSGFRLPRQHNYYDGSRKYRHDKTRLHVFRSGSPPPRSSHDQPP